MTNSERLRKMSDEELARILFDSVRFFSCEECEKDEDKRGLWECDDCEKWILRYLKNNYIGPNEV